MEFSNNLLGRGRVTESSSLCFGLLQIGKVIYLYTGYEYRKLYGLATNMWGCAVV